MRERGGTRGRARSQRRVHREGSGRARERSGARGATDSNRGARPRGVRPARRPRARASAPASAPIRPVPRAEKSRGGIASAHRVGFSHHAPELRRGGDDGGAGLDGLARGGDLGAREEAALDGGDGGHRFGGWWCECGYAGAAARAEGFRIKPAGPRRALAASRRVPDRRSRVRARARGPNRDPNARLASLAGRNGARSLVESGPLFFDSTRPFFFFRVRDPSKFETVDSKQSQGSETHARPIGTPDRTNPVEPPERLGLLVHH